MGCLRLHSNHKFLLVSKINISKKDKSFKRPETMNDLPDSDSSDDPIKNDTYKGLSEAAIHLGEGAVLYL
jgi:hypothetical protein